MDPEKFNQLKKQIETMVSNPSIDNKELAKINSLVNTLTQQRQVGDDLYKKVEDQLIKTKQDLDDKEGRFSKYIEKKKGEIGGIQKQNADEIKKYSDIVQSYQQDIEKFNTQVEKLNKDREFIDNEKQIMVDLRGEVQQSAETIQQSADRINTEAQEAEKLIRAIKYLYTKNIKDVDDTEKNITPPDQEQLVPEPVTPAEEPKNNVRKFPTQSELASLYADRDGKGGVVNYKVNYIVGCDIT
jgi:chromosome segregation ATPase